MVGVLSKRIFAVVYFLSLLAGVWATQSYRPPLFIVPRVDGTVSAFEATSGKPLWNFSTGGPLAQSSAPNEHDTVLSPIEMNIFNSIQRDGLQELYPETNSILGATPFMSPDGTLFLSHKNSKMFGLDPFTGNVVPSDSLQSTRGDTSLFTEDQDCRTMLQIVRTEHTLETHNGSSTRFLTVSHIRAFLHGCAANAGEGGTGKMAGSSIGTAMLPALATTRLGDLQALDNNGNSMWTFNLPAPHSQLVYGMTSNSLRAIRPQYPTEPLRKVPLSLTNYKGTPYELSFGIPELTKTLALPAPVDSHGDVTRKSIWYWIATICICTTATIWGLIILKYQNRRQTNPPPAPAVIPTPSVTPAPSPSTSSFVPRSESSLRLREEHEQLQKQLHELMQLQEQQQQQHLQQTQQLHELQQLQQIQEQQQLLQQQQQLLTPSSSGDSSTVLSRYRTDFEEKERLGEGGFGTVFLAINKLDGVEYAVKKVCLTPGNSKENERVLREVRHLALLDHPNIIRYFQSWIEEDEWDEGRTNPRIEEYEDDDEAQEEEEEEEEEEEGGDEKDEEKRGTDGEEAEGDEEYEGDESKKGGSSLDDSSEFSMGSARTFTHGVASTDSLCDSSASTSSGFRKDLSLRRLAGKKGKRGKRSIATLDLTFERTCGSTSNPISSTDSKRSGSSVKNRKPILYIQMQYCHQGTLHHWLSRTDRTICTHEAVAIFRQAVRGVVHIHANFVIHRDLKPPNILISADGSVKIGDFGLATGGPGEVEGSLMPSPTRTLSRSHTTGVGSPLYCSPEQLNGERYDSKVDIFSLGVILYEMFHIFSTQMERVTHITQLRDGRVNDETKGMFPELVELALRLVHPNPDLRPPAGDILAHPLLAPRTS